MTREECLQFQFAYERVAMYYRRMLLVSSTQGRKSNYEKICYEINDYPELKKYWRICDEAFKYTDKVYQLKELEEYYYKTTLENQVQELPHPTTTKCCSYIVILEKEGCLKVGKTNNFNSRMKALATQYGTVRPIHTFDFDNDEDAFLMEIVLHKYFKQKYPYNFIPQDRFKNADFTLEDLIALEKSAQKIRDIEWF